MKTDSALIDDEEMRNEAVVSDHPTAILRCR